jgi:transposase
MPRHAPSLECSAGDRASLAAISRSHEEDARTVERARIILACLEGKEIQQVAREMGVSIPTVSKWRRNFGLWGLKGLQDRPRTGKPVTYDDGFRTRVLELLEQPPPPSRSHWDGQAVAAKLGASVHAVWRTLRREGIYLERVRGWSVSTDREFTRKAAEIVGLYLDPPMNAMVLCVDEKPSIVAGEGPGGYVETDSGAVVRALKSAHQRRGTLNLLAALEAGTGKVHSGRSGSKRRKDLQDFLGSLLADLPPGDEIHVILDNDSTQAKNDWLARLDQRVRIHVTPNSASWLNQIEILLSLLRNQAFEGSSLMGGDALSQSIGTFIEKHTGQAKPFRWRKRGVRGAEVRNTIVDFRK